MNEFFAERKYSQIPEEFPDQDTYPLFYTAHKREYNLEPGDKLFIPAGWFHFVYSEEGFNFALNKWYDTDWVDDGSPSPKEPKVGKHSKKAKEEWIPDSLKVKVHHSKTNFFPSWDVRHRYKDVLTMKDMTYKEFIESKDPHLYLAQNQINSKPGVYMTNIWVNFGNVWSSIHYDLKDNWLFQIEGRKRVIMFPQEDRDLLYLWNPYPLETIHKLMSPFTTDQFIRRSTNSLPIDLCQRLLASDQYDITDDRIGAQFKCEVETYKQWLEKAGASFPYKTEKTDNKFSRKVPSVPPLPFQVVWILEHGEFGIRKFRWKVKPGDMFLFPLSFVYPWTTNCQIIVPV